jgi:hypothetical protein
MIKSSDAEDDSNIQGESAADQPTGVSSEVSQSNGIVAKFRAPKGTLPRLRFGQLYRFRARMVDIAGNSLEVNDSTLGDLENASDAVGYWRFEPVDPPAMVQCARLTEGESLERMVIRSNYDVSTGAYLSTPDFSNAITLPASKDFEYGEISERHLVPPKSAQQQCEQHGMFDAYFGSPEKIKQGYEIAVRESGSLYDSSPGAIVELITPTSLDGVATTKTLPPALPSKENPVGDRMSAGQYVIHREALVRTPYLPDAAAGGVALRAQVAPNGLPYELPGVTDGMVPPDTNVLELGPSCRIRRTPKDNRGKSELVILIDNGGKWPDSQGFRLILEERTETISQSLTSVTTSTDVNPNPTVQANVFTEVFVDKGDGKPADGRPEWSEDERTLTLFASKGSIARLRYASFVDSGVVRNFGIPNWVQYNSDRKFVTVMATLGCNWMMAPFRPLTLVHAIQQPLFDPQLVNLETTRDPGSQQATLTGQNFVLPMTTLRMVRPAPIQTHAVVCLHGPSTSKIEVEAEWHEWVDDPAQDGPTRVQHKGQLGEIRLAEDAKNIFFLDAAVKDAVVAPDDNPQGIAVDRPQARGDVHNFGDTRFRLVQYRVRATTRFREYLPPSLYAQTDLVTRLGPVAQGERFRLPDENDAGAPVLPAAIGDSDPTISDQQTLVRSSAPPDVPKVLYVVPTFRWSQTRSGDGSIQTSTRLGNGLRVWLDRPWFSSGDGELLGVVLPGDGAPFTGIPAPMASLVTQWGRDPLWDTELPKPGIRAVDFSARVISQDVKSRENGTSVHVVGHRVHWDAGRKLWYCDIEINPGATYMPFVRLALVRYQPNAVADAVISKVVLAEFSQILPHRAATIVRQGSNVLISLRGSVPYRGPIEADNKRMPDPLETTGRNRAELVLQTRKGNSDLDWKDAKVLSTTIIGAGSAVMEETTYLNGESIAVPALPVGSAVVALPANTDQEHSRLVLREFERYFTDKIVKNNAALVTKERLFIEERLVYAANFDLVPGDAVPVADPIQQKWEALGGLGFLGKPLTDEIPVFDNIGKFVTYQGGVIYWHPATGANEVHGAILARWAALVAASPTIADYAGSDSFLGYPLTDELPTPDGTGRFNHFQNGSIYWTPATGAHTVIGAIRDKWAALGWEKSFLGYPVTDTAKTSDGAGRFNDFQGGSIYLTSSGTAYEVHGAIRDKWISLGRETSALGYPTSDEQDNPAGGRISHFQHGTITWTSSGGAVAHVTPSILNVPRPVPGTPPINRLPGA